MLGGMTRWYPLESADETIFRSAPQLHRFPVRLPVPPQRVWESISSDESVSAWPLGVRLSWTSARPFGVGATREVVLPLHAITVREHFFRWDEGKGYSFYVVSANRPGLRRFAEDYVIEADGDGALLTWTIAIEGKPAFAPVLKLLSPVNKSAFGQFARAAKKYFRANP
jgi:hypothetical protein